MTELAESIRVKSPRILVVDDDPDLLHLIGVRLSVAGYAVIQASSGEEALQRCHAEHPQAVITDLRMEGMDGHTLFARLHADMPSLPVIILTAHGTIPDAVAATQRGVFGFLTKPFDGRELLERVAAAMALSPQVSSGGANSPWRDELVSGSAVMEELLRQASRVADDLVPLLIVGPAGTGKTTLARAVHRAGPRAKKAFVTLACGALSDSDLEKQLLAGSAALRQAQGGTLFIDEVGLLSPVAQARLLALVHGSTLMFGLKQAAAGDLRVIAASSMPLDRAIRDGSFRSELYYALAPAVLHVPALAERREDIPLLAAHFLERLGGSRTLSPEALVLIQDAAWPGNIRQLENVLEQAARLSVTSLVPASLVQRLLQEDVAEQLAGFDDARRAFERDYLERLLKSTGGNVARAARIAERNRTEFYKLLARHGLDPASFK